MPDSIGQIITQTRSQKGISLLQVYRAIHIKERYLTAIENDRYDDLPSAVQGRGFIRLYWEYLGLPAPELESLLSPARVQVEPLTAGEDHEVAKAGSELPKVDDIGENREPVIDNLQQPEIKHTSTQIYKEIGEELRTQRSRLSLSLDNIEEITHIPLHYVQALEAGQFDTMPSPVQGKGMLSNYSDFLNLDSDKVLLKYAEALQLKREEALLIVEKKQKRLAFRLPKPGGMRKQGLPIGRSIFSLDIFLVGILVMITFGSLIWGASAIVSYQVDPKSTKTAQAAYDALAKTATADAALISTTTLEPIGTETSVSAPVEEAPTATLSAPTTSSFPIQVFVVAQQRAYLQIIVDGKVAFNGRVIPGNPYLFSGNKRIELTTGNAAALQVIYNQTDLGNLGGPGEVIHLVFSMTEYGTPTLTPSITPSATLKPTRTLIPSNTYPPTRTPRPTSTIIPTRTRTPTRTPTP